MKTKKAGILILMTALMTSLLAGCSGKAEPDENSGLYKAVSVKGMGTELSADEVYDDDVTIDLADGGKAVFTFEGDDYKLKWSRDGKHFEAKGGGAELSGTIGDGVLVLEDVVGTGMDIRLECKSLVRKASRGDKDKPDEGKTKDVDEEDTGKVTALLEEGRAYYYGKDSEWNVDSALEAFTKVAENKDAAPEARAEALYFIGQIHVFRCNYEEAMDAFEQAEELGNALATVMRGNLYMNGTGVPTDTEMAKRCYEEALDKGCVEANTGLGDIYAMGLGVDVDLQKAEGYFEKGLESNEPEWQAYANICLGQMYDGRFFLIGKDLDRAIGYYTKADEISAQMNVFGRSAKREIVVVYSSAWFDKLAEEWEAPALADFEAADAQGGLKSTYELGYAYMYATWLEEDNEKGLTYFQKAADKNHASAMGEIGWNYLNGYVGEADPALGEEWMNKAGESGDASSYFSLGNAYANGRFGLPQDDERAVMYYQKAVDMGHWSAMNTLGLKYLGGDGVEQDSKRGVELLLRAGNNGGAVAYTNLGNYYYWGTVLDLDYEKAYEYFCKSAGMGDESGMYMMARLYAEGAGVEENPKAALAYSLMCVEAGDYNDLGADMRDAMLEKLGPEYASKTWRELFAEIGMDPFADNAGNVSAGKDEKQEVSADINPDVVGSYEMVEFTDDDGTVYSGAELKESGVDMYIKLYADGTGVTNMGLEDGEQPVSWNRESVTDAEGLVYPYSYEDGMLVLVEDAFLMKFEKRN
ncbi:MAG: sel1 repeat family protein [Lachnospiraceae bacterium]|nr:sel1 repeat family protein [Lachnospiraceae bacterium]